MSGPGAWAVTPEAVVLELPTATLGTRVPARIVDLLVEALGAGIVIGVLALTVGNTALLVVTAVLGFGVLFVYPTALESSTGGRTVGKLALGLRVISADGAPISFRQAAVRAALGPVDLVVGVVVMLVSRRAQRLGDILAGTVVVRERTGTPAAAMAVFGVPPGCEQVVAGLDVSGMTDEDYEVVRAYLLRWAELTAAARWTLGVDLARLLASRLGHGLPPWIGPDQYLACLAAGYQRRQYLLR